MKLDDLHILPKFSDGWSYLYVEHCRVEREQNAIAIYDTDGMIPVPCANLALLMLGPGTSISHAAITVLADHGCLIIWCGEQGVRFYATGMGETRNAARLLHQAFMWSHENLRFEVVRRLYAMRFTETLPSNLSLSQIRGLEGRRVRLAYDKAARASGIPWKGRQYDRHHWTHSDPVNRALSTANSCLYGLCHSAIVSSGFSPAIGFIHTGKMLSFVYDIADLYKTEITVPIAFQAAAQGDTNLERRVRISCRDAFAESHLLARIIPDIQKALAWQPSQNENSPLDSDPALPSHLWDPDLGAVQGGIQQPATSPLPPTIPAPAPESHDGANP